MFYQFICGKRVHFALTLQQSAPSDNLTVHHTKNFPTQ